jgi:hypothetical protein
MSFFTFSLCVKKTWVCGNFFEAGLIGALERRAM